MNTATYNIPSNAWFSVCILLLLGSFGSISLAADKSWTAPSTIKGATTINASKIFDLVKIHDDLIVVDSRKVSDFSKGNIEDSINLPDTKTNSQSLSKILSNTDTPVVFYCNGIHCKRSSNAARLAIDAGYKNVFWYRLGWDEWLAEGLPVSRN